MATSTIIRRNSYDHLRGTDFNEYHGDYSCDCGEEFMTIDTLQHHQQTNCKNRSKKCPFCNEVSTSLDILRNHLVICGNKTDECPKCRQRIRRSHFAYHYENDCAPVNTVDTPPTRPKSRQMQSMPTNSNRPILRVDIPTDGARNNYSNHNSPNIDSRSPSQLAITINPQNIMECEFCHNQCIKNDYQAHKERCLRNPANTNVKTPVRTNLSSNHHRTSPNAVVHIPCEFCTELIDLPNWALHIRDCRERDQQRITRRVDEINREPIIDQISCQHCGQLCLIQQLSAHERDCMQNRENQRAARNTPRQRPLQSIALPVKQINNPGQPVSSDIRVRNNAKTAHYQCIDLARTREANMAQNNGTNVVSRNSQPNLARHIPSDEDLSRPILPREVTPNNGERIRYTDLRTYDNYPSPSRDRSTNEQSHQSRSLDNLANSPRRQPIRSEAADNNRSPSVTRKTDSDSQRGKGKKTNSSEFNQRTKKKKPSALARFFGCTSPVYD